MCGIFGIINKKPKAFDAATFCVLGVENDSRGGDSCGIFIDGKYEYGVNNKKLFSKFFIESKLLNKVKDHTIALGHCRKASVGAINEDNAQPVIIKNKDKVEYVLIHNGTIYNYKELADKYIPNINITNMTDSQVMAHIFYHTGYDVLGEYIGAGAFVMVDYRDKKEQIFLFKGESKSSMHSTTTSVERPLYCSFSDSEFIFSSLPTYLQALRPKNKVCTIESNKLIKLVKAQPKLHKIYNRSALCQNAPKVVTYPTYYDGYYPNPSIWQGCISCDEDFVFNIKGSACHGLLHVNIYGGAYTEKRNNTEPMYFWNGALLKNEECFHYLSLLSTEFTCNAAALEGSFPELINYLSIYPYINFKDEYIRANTPDTVELITEEIEVPFAYRKLKIEKGKLTNISYTKERAPLLDLVATYRLQKINFKTIDTILSDYGSCK